MHTLPGGDLRELLHAGGRHQSLSCVPEGPGQPTAKTPATVAVVDGEPVGLWRLGRAGRLAVDGARRAGAVARCGYRAPSVNRVSEEMRELLRVLAPCKMAPDQ